MNDCPTCGEGFEDRRAVKLHHASAHGERLIDTAECEFCGDEFEVKGNTEGKYCSTACCGRDQRRRVAFECVHCGDTFDVKQNRVDDNPQFCSQACRSDAGRERRECAGCGRGFRVKRSVPAVYCCRTCESESKSERPRPDDVDALLWLLYVYEGWDYQQTFERQRAVRGAANALSKSDVRNRLAEQGVFVHESQYNFVLEKMNADDVGRGTPDGDDTWRAFYQRAGGD